MVLKLRQTLSRLRTPSELLKIPGHLGAERQVAGVEPLDLLDAGAGVLGEVEDVDLPLRQDDPHADRRVPQRVERVLHAGGRDPSSARPAPERR